MLVITNARIHTLDPISPFASAIAIDADRIVAVGNDRELLEAFSAGQKLDAVGRTLIPGLIDAHIHLEDYALSRLEVDCETPTRQECLQRVADRAKATPEGEWVRGHGWNQNSWLEGYGNAGLLDEITTNHPVFLTHKSLHCAWANNLALQKAGIDRNTADPPNGRIGRMDSGEPDGILYESAMDLIYAIIPEPSIEQVVDALRDAQAQLVKMGLTGAHDFDRGRCFSALQVLHQASQLKLRVVKSIPMEDLPRAIEIGLRSGFGDDQLRIGSVKLFSDGALGPHTAAMLEPYEDDTSNSGILMLDAEQLYDIGMQAVEHGLSLAIHAIGDKANRAVLDAYAQLRRYESTVLKTINRSLRHRIEHVQVLHPDDIYRFSELDIIASMQPIHAISDMLMADRYWGKRSANAYAWREQLKHGSKLIFGSDAPVENPNPFWGLHAAVTRRRADGTPSPAGWYPEQRLTVQEALEAFTTGPAYASGMENRLGMLAPKYLADLLILNKDPFTCPPGELLEIHPVATMVGGEWAFSELE